MEAKPGARAECAEAAANGGNVRDTEFDFDFAAGVPGHAGEYNCSGRRKARGQEWLRHRTACKNESAADIMRPNERW